MEKTLPLQKGEITLTPEKLVIKDGFGKIRRNRMLGSAVVIAACTVFLWIRFYGKDDSLSWMWIVICLAHLVSLLMFLLVVIAHEEVMLSDIRYGRFVNMPSGRFLSLKLTNSRIRRVGPLGMEELDLKPALEELGVTMK
jgi:hypothetical protein